ncbi:MAG TPA: hypothetical protein VMN78_10165 [Longimicrobiales bacterium]|nr:hypothetical protein [Longimicrobiales bacterium]
MARRSDTPLDRARDELFSHIHQCGVLESSDEQKMEWMEETIDFMGERYPMLSKRELNELRDIGMRFCQPVIPHGRTEVAVAEEDAA